MTTSIMTNIKVSLDKEFNDYITRVAARFDLDRDELYKMRTNEGGVSFTPPVERAVCEPVVISQPTVNQPVERKKAVSRCQYVLLRGAMKGSMCGKNTGKNGGDFCCRHTNSAPVSKSRKTQAIPEPIDVLQQSKVLRRNKSFGRLWHEESGMVFESGADRTVVKRCVNGSLQDLSNEDIDLCKELGFAYRRNDKKSIIPDEDTKLPCDMDIETSKEEEVDIDMSKESWSEKQVQREKSLHGPADVIMVKAKEAKEVDSAENIHALLNGLRIDEDEILEEEY